ncbi:MAG: hypothetical protein ACRD5G_02440 [Candidatus Acidiferrales bacterium]
MGAVEKKERERRDIERARQRSEVFPAGRLEMNDGPDGRIASASLGIEVTQLLPARESGVLLTGPDLAARQAKIVRTGEQSYKAQPCAPPADVLVYFRNDWTNKRGVVAEMGQVLATFVTNNYPSDKETVVLEELTPGVVGWVDGLHVVRITRESGSWQAGACSGIESVTYDRLAEVIADKNQKVSTYRSRVPGWQIWLLIVTRMSVLWSVSIPREVTSWRFSCDFDRVVLSSWEDGVLELKTSGVHGNPP